MWEYTDKVKEHFINPKNVGEIENEANENKVIAGSLNDEVGKFKLR